MPPSKAAIAPYFTSRLKSAWNSSRRFRVHIAAPPAAIPMQRKVSQAGPWNRRLRSLSSMGCDPPPERSRHREKRSDAAIQSRRRQQPTGRVLHPVDRLASLAMTALLPSSVSRPVIARNAATKRSRAAADRLSLSAVPQPRRHAVDGQLDPLQDLLAGRAGAVEF